MSKLRQNILNSLPKTGFSSWMSQPVVRARSKADGKSSGPMFENMCSIKRACRFSQKLFQCVMSVLSFRDTFLLLNFIERALTVVKLHSKPPKTFSQQAFKLKDAASLTSTPLKTQRDKGSDLEIVCAPSVSAQFRDVENCKCSFTRRLSTFPTIKVLVAHH